MSAIGVIATLRVQPGKEEAFEGVSKEIQVEALAKCEVCAGHGSRGEARAAEGGARDLLSTTVATFAESYFPKDGRVLLTADSAMVINPAL